MRSLCSQGGAGSRVNAPRVSSLLLLAIGVSTACGSSGSDAGTADATSSENSTSGSTATVGGTPSATVTGTTSPGESSTDGTSTTGSVTGDFTVDLSLSEAIQTVGIVEFSTSRTLDSARIEFGRQPGSYEYSAPVDLAEPNYRTLLLGMKEATTYYVQVFGESGGTTLSSEVLTVETGNLPNSTPNVTVNDVNASALYGGFTINCTGVGGIGGTQGSGVAFIIDQDGDAVWSYDLAGTVVSGCSRARMSYDGKDMWIGNFSNVSPDGALMRLRMDGLTNETYSFPGRHHDFTVLPNNNVLFQEQENGGMGMGGADEGPDIIRELDVNTGTAREIYHENTDFSEQIAESGAHTNYIKYVPHLNAISFSMRHTSTIAVITYPEVGETAELLMVFGGPLTDFDFSWEIQHGHEVLENSILIFNNNAEGSFGESAVLEYEYDLATGTGTKVLDYRSGNSSGAFGDAHRLPNGNTFITYSTAGVWHEIDAAGTLLREMTTDGLGYSQHRKELYGPPPI